MDLLTLARLARSRAKPGEYADWTDEELGAAYAKKFNIPVEPVKETGIIAGIKNLAKGAQEMVIPAEKASDVLEGPAYALRHPIDSAKLLFDAAQQGSQDQFENMYAAPTLPEAVGHAASGLIPGVGPALGQTGERIGQFGVDNQEGMRGVGNLLGLLLGGKALERGGGLARDLVRSRVTEAPPLSPGGNSLAPADMPVVPMLRSEAAGGGGVSKLERALESSIPGAGPFEAFRRVQQNALIDDLGGATTSRMAQPGANLRPYDIGTTLREALVNATDDIRKGLHRGYARLGKEMRDTPVDLSPVSKVAERRLADIAGNDLIPSKPSELNALQPLIDNTQASFDSVRQFRTAARKGELPFHEDVQPAMVDAATQALRNAAQRKGQLPRMERLDTGWADWEKNFNDPKSLVAKMRDATPPEKIHTKLVGASLDDIKRIKDSVGPETFRDVKARLLQDMIEESMTGELDVSPVKDKVIARTTGGVLDKYPIEQSGRHVSGKKMHNILEDKSRFGEERLKTIFDGPKELEAVKHFTNVAEKVGASPSSLVGAFINAQIISDSLYGGFKMLSGDFAGGIHNWGRAATTYGVANALSRRMTGGLSPTRLMSRVISKAGGAKAMANYIEALGKKNAGLPEPLRFKVPDQSGRGKAYFWGRIVGKMARDEAEKLSKAAGPQEDDQ